MKLSYKQSVIYLMFMIIGIHGWESVLEVDVKEPGSGILKFP